MKYGKVTPMSRAEAEVALSSGSPDAINRALLSLAYHDNDWHWVQDTCIKFTNYPDPQVSGLAVTCLGHLARIHQVLDTEKVLPILQKLRCDPKIAGRVEDALDDIDMYLHERIKTDKSS
jgi:hypothetical protein